MTEWQDNSEVGDAEEQIAIVGISGRFPGAKTLDQFWENLRDGVESITFFTETDMAGSNIDPALLNNPKYVRADGVIEDMDLFDAEFFGFAPREAEIMDPQHRLFIECAWEALEHAGYDSESYDGRVGVYASANLSSYLVRNIATNPKLRDSATSFQTLLGNDKDFIATKVSYKFNLTGPSVNVATLCSSSFVAIHLACQSLLGYQCDLALAGAVSLQVSRNEAFFYQEGGIGDPDGHCRAFDARANGTVSGSGLGIVVLKRLEDALADGDCIHAVIRGSAVNNDGALKISYTAPSVEGQAEVIAEALAMAEVSPETITYVETHGTGTRLGDPIEVEALTKAFRAGTEKKGYCAIGSVKTNIGHLVNAGGVASLIKTILAMKHKQIPPSLNFEAPNPRINFADSPFYVVTKLTDWKTNEFPRRAGVSSFGIGGTNVHIVVEEAPEIELSGEARPWQLLVLSARTGTALETTSANLAEYLAQNPDINLADAAYTLQVGRRAFNHRRVLLCRDREEALSALGALDPARVSTQFQESRDRPVAFMFSGLGEQQVQMGLDLYYGESTFREQVDLCAEVLEPLLRLDLRTVLYPSHERVAEAKQLFRRPAVAQAALFVLEYALARLWLEWGIQPQAMIGEGIGEYVAACLSGILSLEDALARVVAGGPDPAGESQLNPPQIPLVSSVTGTWLTDGEALDPERWTGHQSQAGSFAEGIKSLLRGAEQVLLEIGPGQALNECVLNHPDKAQRQVVLSSLHPEQDGQSDVACLLTTLGQLWLAGVKVDWNGFHTHERRHRIPLPTYPFERRRYWIEPSDLEEGYATRASQAGNSLTVKKPDIADWFYIPSWKRSLLPALPGEMPAQACWLLFVDEHGLGTQLAERLRSEDQRVITVKAGVQFSRLGAETFALDPGCREDYDALLESLGALEACPQEIVHLWSVADGDLGRGGSAKRVDRALDLGFYSLLFLAQALGKQGLTGDLQITVISNNLQEVTANDVLCPEKATVLGPVKVIPQEYPNITCRSIDLTLSEPGTRQEARLVNHLWAELVLGSTDTVVAYRGPHRWVQTFESVRLDGSNKASSCLQEEGVYLIAGGLEGIGFVLAEHLAQTVKARLILTHHATFPARKHWDSWLDSHPTDDPLGRQIRKLRDWEKQGAEVLTLSADVTARSQMQAAIAQAKDRFGRLDGVIYAAGGFGRASLDSVEGTDRVRCEQQFQQSIRGPLVLAEALSDRTLDCCLLISSLSSVLGGLGLVTYAAANNFLDALAHQNNRTSSSPWLSINWDYWQFDQDRGRDMALGAQLEKLAIVPTEGVEAFECILSCGAAGQIIVSTVDLPARIVHWLTPERIDEGESPEQGQRLTLHARPDLLTPYLAPRNEIEQSLVDIWKQVVGIDRIGVHDDFFELGGDSLLAVQIISRARETFEMDLPLTNLFERPTVAFLAEYIQTIRWAAQGLQADPNTQEHGREEIEL